MRHHRTLVPALTAAAFALGACGSSAPAPAGPSGSAGATGGSHVVTAVKVANGSLGDVVTDGDGMTLYLFTKDTKGSTTSACTGKCLTAWPPALVGATAPKADGVSAVVSSIPTPDGGKQLTLGGWPLYYYAPDTAAGDTRGQGVGGVWWVVKPDGTAVTSGDAGSYGGGY